MCRVIAVSNQKGGVGKTVSCGRAEFQGYHTDIPKTEEK